MAYTGQLTGSVVGKDPEVKYFENGSIVANLSLSVRQYKKKGAEVPARYVRVAIWGKSAEYVGNYVKRGDSVLITGRVEAPEIYTSNAGETKVNEKFSADQIEKFTPREDQAAATPAAADTGACPMPPAAAAPPMTVQQQNVAAFQAAQAAQQQRQQQAAPVAAPTSGEIPF
jgi:single-strand DNA-binding protein